MERRLLEPAERESALATLPGWALCGERLCRTFRFAGFVEAFGFMAQVALLAERLNHHPEWRNVYDRVEIALTTHDLGGLSTLDVELARRIDQVAGA